MVDNQDAEAYADDCYCSMEYILGDIQRKKYATALENLEELEHTLMMLKITLQELL